MSGEHIPDVTDEVALHFAEIDLAIEEHLRDLFDYLDDEGIEIDPIDRTCLTCFMRMAYVQGWDDHHDETMEQMQQVKRRLSAP